MLVINAVLTLLAAKQNHHLISLKIDSDAQYWELWINSCETEVKHTHSCSSRSKPTDDNLKSLPNYQVQYTNRWQRSTA